jgi:hypothetical protein
LVTGQGDRSFYSCINTYIRISRFHHKGDLADDSYILNGFRALQVRRDMSEGGLIRMIGDILCENVSGIVI